jgi:hypothetical protein
LRLTLSGPFFFEHRRVLNCRLCGRDLLLYLGDSRACKHGRV